MFYDFETTTHGKWILVGEHAVIRGHGAIVFPIQAKKLTLSYHQSTSKLSATYEGDSGTDTHLLFWSVLEQGMQLLSGSINSLNGHFNLYSNIPVGVGMGASAALCVAMTRWFVAQNMLNEKDTDDFAKQLEHLFHGKSSGLDIAGVATTTGVFFKEGQCSPIEKTWQPHWTLSSCGQIGITSHCIQQVQLLWEKNPLQAAQIDTDMSQCVEDTRLALEKNSPSSKILLANAMNKAAECFKGWGLVSESLEKHMQSLRHAGAIAVKPTGSGGGGFVVSLWEKQPPEMAIDFITV